MQPNKWNIHFLVLGKPLSARQLRTFCFLVGNDTDQVVGAEAVHGMLLPYHLRPAGQYMHSLFVQTMCMCLNARHSFAWPWKIYKNHQTCSFNKPELRSLINTEFVLVIVLYFITLIVYIIAI